MKTYEILFEVTDDGKKKVSFDFNPYTLCRDISEYNLVIDFFEEAINILNKYEIEGGYYVFEI